MLIIITHTTKIVKFSHFYKTFLVIVNNYMYICTMIKTINKTYRFRIYPNASQMELLAKHFGCTHFVYNYFLTKGKSNIKRKERVITTMLRQRF